jgi:hypothetical protein
MYLEAARGGRDAFLVAFPLIGILLMVVFRLDELVFQSAKKERRPAPRGVDPNGREFFNDPDGRPCPRR